MKYCFAKRIFSVYGNFRKIFFYAVLLVSMSTMFISCGVPKKSSNIKKIERQSRKNPPPTDMAATAKATKDSKIKKAIKKQEQQKIDAAKAADKAEKNGIKQHREAQTEETRKRMDENRKLSKKSNEEQRAAQKKEARKKKKKKIRD